MIARERVESVLNLIRPAMRADGGDIELLDVFGNGARVRLTGKCAGCPSAYMTLYAGVERALRQEIADTCGSADAASFVDFADWLRRLYLVEMPTFIDANFDSPLDLLASPRAAARLVRLGGFRRLGPVIRSRFRDERLHRLFSFQALYAGLPPARALALCAVITYMDTIEGVWFPDGGMDAVAAALAAAAARAGAEVRLGTTVERILLDRRGAVAGVGLAGGEAVRADAVVCTLDLPTAYDRLLPQLRAPRAVRAGQYAPSAVVWHVGVRGLPDAQTAHHNIHFGADWDGAFDALVRDRTLMPDPSRLVTVPTVTEPDLAPDGCSVLYVLEPVPNLSGRVDWVREREPMRERLQQFLHANGYPTDVVTQQLVTPLDWERMGMHLGTPFALAHTFRQTGPFRPPNVERRVPGLFFAGSGTVPGVGLPMVLVSGKLAARRVAHYIPGSRR